jgi:PAS domain-containing protein
MDTKTYSPLARFIDHLLDAICIVDGDGRFIFVSAACERIFGYTPKEMVGKAMLEMVVGAYRWLTVVSKEQPDGTELLLEPCAHPAVAPYKKALVEDGIPATSFHVDHLDAEYERLKGNGVKSPNSLRMRDLRGLLSLMIRAETSFSWCK